MLMQMKLDAMKSHVDFDKKLWPMLPEQLKDIAAYNGQKWITVFNKYGNGLKTDLLINGQRLEVSVLQHYKSRWISYGFNGCVDIPEFDHATCLFGDYSFKNAIKNHRAKRLELAVDYFGLQSSELITHCIGVQKSLVYPNKKKTGFSQYSGSRDGPTQLSVYDKGQEVLDKGGVPVYKKLLRVELRLINRKNSLHDLIKELRDKDPFERVLLIKKDTALKFPSGIKAWPLFISVCSEQGVANALHQFPAHKKTFLAMLKNPALQTRIPSMRDFKKPLDDFLLPFAPT